MAKAVGWRKIETALIAQLREKGFEITQEGGESFTDVWIDPNGNRLEICIGDFAKELEERL